LSERTARPVKPKFILKSISFVLTFGNRCHISECAWILPLAGQADFLIFAECGTDVCFISVFYRPRIAALFAAIFSQFSQFAQSGKKRGSVSYLKTRYTVAYMQFRRRSRHM
jgi:hypothetical protein